MSNQSAELIWRDGTIPVSTRFDDPYFSLENGLNETRHVFLDGNDLPARFAKGFHIAELGFGSGLNFLAVWQAWEAAGMETGFPRASLNKFGLDFPNGYDAVIEVPIPYMNTNATLYAPQSDLSK